MGVGDNSNNTTVCPPMGAGLDGLGKYMAGIALSHGRTDERGRDTVNQRTLRNLDHLTDEEQAELDEFITGMFKRMSEFCNDKYCKDNAFEDVVRARDLYDDVTEEFSRTDVWEAFDHALDELGDHLDRYDKAAAHDDSLGEVEHIFWDYEKDFLPKIMNRQCEHGVYNDTSTQLLINNAYAETTNKAAALVLKTMENYEKLVLEAAGLEITTMRDFMNHVYRMTKLTMDEVDAYFSHVMAFGELGLAAMRVSLDAKTKDEFKSDMTTHYGKITEKSINADGWAFDMIVITAGLVLLKDFLFPPNDCVAKK